MSKFLSPLIFCHLPVRPTAFIKCTKIKKIHLKRNVCKTIWPFHLFVQVHDGFPLRLWKVTVEVPASPEEVLTRVLREQGHWDEDLLESRTVETLDERTEVYHYVRNTMAPHPTRDHLVLR